jgi:hypothetical protein
LSRVDIITPCYKYGRFLRRCVESALTQEGVDVRVLILDDASPDETPDVAAELARQDSRVHYRRHTVNQGHIATYNEGLDWASGDYLLLLGADDLLTPGALQRAVRLLNAHPEVGMACGQQIHFQTEHELLAARSGCNPHTARILSSAEFLNWFCVSGSNPVASPTPVVRTALQKAIGGYREELPHTADMELWMRVAVHSSIAILDIPQAFKRDHGNNMQHQFVGLRDLEQRQAAFDVLFREFAQRIPDSARLQRLANRALAQEAFWAASTAFEAFDQTACRTLLQFAASTDPSLPSQPQWSRLTWKRRVGPRVWEILSPLMARCRELNAKRADKAAARRAVALRNFLSAEL